MYSREGTASLIPRLAPALSPLKSVSNIAVEDWLMSHCTDEEEEDDGMSLWQHRLAQAMKATEMLSKSIESNPPSTIPSFRCEGFSDTLDILRRNAAAREVTWRLNFNFF